MSAFRGLFGVFILPTPLGDHNPSAQGTVAGLQRTAQSGDSSLGEPAGDGRKEWMGHACARSVGEREAGDRLAPHLQEAGDRLGHVLQCHLDPSEDPGSRSSDDPVPPERVTERISEGPSFVPGRACWSRLNARVAARSHGRSYGASRRVALRGRGVRS
jgi:hypothetical protein